jgi:hypothetical protein
MRLRVACALDLVAVGVAAPAVVSPTGDAVARAVAVDDEVTGTGLAAVELGGWVGEDALR